MMRSGLIIGCLAAQVPSAIAAQEVFNLPAGCEAYLTIQSRSCQVSHHFTCAGDPEGLQRRVDLGEEGMTYSGSIDAEAQWVESYHIRSGHAERLEAEPVDRASLSELIANGLDSYDFQTLSDEIGVTRYAGQDSLTGQLIEIDGVTLRQTAYQITAFAPDGTFLWSAEGNEFISEDWRMFLSGTGTITTPDETWDTNDSPMEFIFPGEPGFLSANPKHECGVMMSRYEGE